MKLISQQLKKLKVEDVRKISLLAWVLLMAVILNSVLYLLPLVKTGFPPTHDGEGHIARAANYAVAFRQGSVPPRWAPTFWNGYGYPILNFHYPLLSMLATPFILVKIHPEMAVKLILAGAVVFTAGGLFWLLKRWGKTAALFGVSAFLLSPYYFNLLFVRGAYGEVMAYLCLAWLVLAIEQVRIVNLIKAKWWEVAGWLGVLAGATAGLSLSHNITAMILVPSVFVLAILRWWKTPNFIIGILTMMAAMGTTMFFWLPALLEKDFTFMDGAVLREFPIHFPTWSQIFYSPVQQGFSIEGPDDTMALTPGILTWVVVLGSGALLLFHKKFRHTEGKTVQRLLVVWAVCLFFTMAISFPLWQIIKPLQYMQFSWRFLGMMIFMGAVLAAIVYRSVPKFFKFGLVVMVVGLTVARVNWPVKESLHYPKEYYFNHIQTTTVWDDARPRTFIVEQGQLSPQRPLVEGEAEVTVHDWKGVYHVYSVKNTQLVEITEPTAYFPGWEVEANGQKLELHPEEALGQIHYRLEPGEYTIRTRFTQNTFPRMLGNTLTVLSGLFIVGMIGLAVAKKLPKQLFLKFKNSN